MNSKKTLKKNRNRNNSQKKSKKLNSNIKYRKLNKQYTKKKNYVGRGGGGIKKKVAATVVTAGLYPIGERIRRSFRRSNRSQYITKNSGLFRRLWMDRVKLIRNESKTKEAFILAGLNNTKDYKKINNLQEALTNLNEKIKELNVSYNNSSKTLTKLNHARNVLKGDINHIKAQSSIFIKKLLGKETEKYATVIKKAFSKGEPNERLLAKMCANLPNFHMKDLKEIRNGKMVYKNELKKISVDNILNGQSTLMRNFREAIYNESDISGEKITGNIEKDLGLDVKQVKGQGQDENVFKFNMLEGRFEIIKKNDEKVPITQELYNQINDIPDYMKNDIERELKQNNIEEDLKSLKINNEEKIINELRTINPSQYKNANELLENNPGLNKLIPKDNKQTILNKINDRFFKAVVKTRALNPTKNRQKSRQQYLDPSKERLNAQDPLPLTPPEKQKRLQELQPRKKQQQQQQKSPPPLPPPRVNRSIKPKSQSNLSKTETEIAYANFANFANFQQKSSQIPNLEEGVIYADIRNPTSQKNESQVRRRESTESTI